MTLFDLILLFQVVLSGGATPQGGVTFNVVTTPGVEQTPDATITSLWTAKIEETVANESTAPAAGEAFAPWAPLTPGE